MTDPDFIPCTEKYLPRDLWEPAAETAVKTNPLNRPRLLGVAQVAIDVLKRFGVTPPARQTVVQPGHLALLVGKRWPASGVEIPCTFIDGTPVEIQNRIMSYAMKWQKFGNVKFRLTNDRKALCRIARTERAYYSFLGTDNKHIPLNQHTMMLGGINMQTTDDECDRVIPHEFGHLLGFPHEHARRDLVSRLDPVKTIALFEAEQHWSEQEIYQQVLTPLEESSYIGTLVADQNSVMCYRLSGSITKDGQPIVGGKGIDLMDQQFIASVYPLPQQPPPPPPPGDVTMVVPKAGTWKWVA